MQKQEPTGAAHRAAGGIPVIHGREDVKYVLNEYAQPVLDKPNHYHPWCLPARPTDE